MAAIANVVVWTYSKLVALLEGNNAALERAILAIEARQTPDERGAGITRHENGRGWNQRDASFGGSLAQWIEKGLRPRQEGGFGKAPGTCLTPRQREGALRMVRKYWRQLLEEIANKGGEVDYKAPAPKREAATQQRGSFRRPLPPPNEGMTATQEEGHDSRPPNGWFTHQEVGLDEPEF